MRLLPLAGLLLALAALAATRPAAPTTHTVRLNGHNFTLPVGFTVEVAAQAPLVDRPITADFDEEGRLYVSDSSGSNAKVADQLRDRPHRIVRLEAPEGKGTFTRSGVFADRMMFPEGTLWHDGSLYVAAPPSIWKLTDTDGDGKADRREEWFAGKTLTGCANDLHGPYLGRDGRIYWAKGAFAEQRYQRPGKPDLVTKAAHLFRARPDGRDIEPVMTGGMDNPVDVVSTPTGERIFTTTFFQYPAGGRRDGLVHAVHGGVYGKDHSVVYDHPWTAPTLMPVLTHMGPAAPAGLAVYESAVFGPEYRDNLFAVQFNLQKVSRHILTPDGATYASRDEDFLVSDNRDFHPTDVLEDADGSLLVVDTGGWYKLCCPTSQLVKPDILGAIYRVRKIDAPRLDDPRGRKIAWEKLSARALTGLLDDPRPAVVRRALHRLGTRGAEAVTALNPVVRSGRSITARRNAVWAATRIDSPGAREVVRVALGDTDAGVTQAALNSVSLWRDRGALMEVKDLLKSKSAHVRRVAAEALGRMEDVRAIPALLEALASPADRMLEHSLTYALIEIGRGSETAQGLSSADPRVRRAALVALDQMGKGLLRAEQVAKELTSPHASLKETAWWIAGKHPEWGATLAGFFRDRMRDANVPPAHRDELVAQLGRFARNSAIQALLTERLREGKLPEQLLSLRAMAGSGLKPPPSEWVAGIVRALEQPQVDLQRAAAATARALPLTRAGNAKLVERLLALANDGSAVGDVRLGAMAAVPGGLTEVTAPQFAFLTSKLDSDQPVQERAFAVEVLTRARLSGEQLGSLAELPRGIGPMELDRLLDAFTKTTESRIGTKLVASLQASPVRSSLRVDGLKTRLAKYGPEVQKPLASLCAELDADAVKQRAHLESLLGTLKGGDIRRGQLVFNSPRAACATCHAIGYLGGKVGPDLTRIGGIRAERDLLEAILYPSASFVRSYEPVQVATASGKIHNGLVKKDTPEEIVLQTTATEEVRIPRGEVEQVVPGKVSIMPAGMEKVLSQQEMIDLVAFLRACK